MPKIIGYDSMTTVEGDTFDKLALRYYNDERQSSIIIGANLDYCDTLIFDAGVELKIPIVDDVEMPETLPPWRRDT